jgi:hypothetical protein
VRVRLAIVVALLATRTAVAAQNPTPRVEAGIDVSHFQVHLSAWMDGGVAADVYLHTDRSHSVYEGGRISQAMAGIKVGRRERRAGHFGKLRTGVQSYSEGRSKCRTSTGRRRIRVSSTPGGIVPSSTSAP